MMELKKLNLETNQIFDNDGEIKNVVLMNANYKVVSGDVENGDCHMHKNGFTINVTIWNMDYEDTREKIELFLNDLKTNVPTENHEEV